MSVFLINFVKASAALQIHEIIFRKCFAPVPAKIFLLLEKIDYSSLSLLFIALVSLLPFFFRSEGCRVGKLLCW